MQIFNSKAFISTLASFSVFKSSPKNDTFDFIKQLFNFDILQRNIVYINHRIPPALQEVIILGLYDEFEKLLDNIQSTSKPVKCDSRDKLKLNNAAKKHLRELNISENDSVKSFLIKISTEKMKNKVLNFIFYCACIHPYTRKVIMRHYLLTFIKTSIFNESKIQLYYTLEDERKEKIINDFFVSIVIIT